MIASVSGVLLWTMEGVLAADIHCWLPTSIVGWHTYVEKLPQVVE
jgi:hypothetical protein